jgi:ubiquinone/menaquinone biosynthesis C-methylase UbiE
MRTAVNSRAFYKGTEVARLLDMTVYNLDTSNLATTYDELSDSQFTRGRKLVEDLRIEPHHVVLDIGAGTGRLGLEVLRTKLGAAGKLFGIDPLDERIKVAERKNTFPNGQFRVRSAEDLSFLGDGTVDVAYLSAVFHWVPDKGKALSEIHRVLKPGGKLGITTGARELANKTVIRQTLDRVLAGPKYRDRVNPDDYVSSKQGTTSTELINLLTDAGFEVEEVAVRRNSTYHESGARLVDFLESSTFGNLLVHVPEDLRRSARAEYVEALEAISAGNGINSVGFGISAIAHRTFAAGLPFCSQPQGCSQGGELASLAGLRTSG